MYAANEKKFHPGLLAAAVVALSLFSPFAAVQFITRIRI
jgi:hypothetical protein